MLWDVATGGVRVRLRLGEGAVAIAFGPDDTTLYSSGEDRATGSGTSRGRAVPHHRGRASRVLPAGRTPRRLAAGS